MKKILLILVALLLVLGIASWFYGSILLGGATKRALETFGPKVAQVEVRVGSVGISALSGSGALKGLVIGNPQGYQSPSAIKAETIRVAVAPGSLFGKKIHVRSLVIESPEITYEGGLDGNNLTKIRDNIQSFTGGSSSKSETRLQVDEFIIRGGRIHVAAAPLGGKALSVPLPEIHLTHLGDQGDGITIPELSQKVVGEVLKESLGAVAKSAGQLFKGAEDAAKNLNDEGKDLIKGIGNLFK